MLAELDPKSDNYHAISAPGGEMVIIVKLRNESVVQIEATSRFSQRNFRNVESLKACLSLPK
jgi:hypothetical protein